MLCSTILNGKQLLTEQSQVVIPWWSFTKTVLAAAALSLVRDGLIQLDDPGSFFLLHCCVRCKMQSCSEGQCKEGRGPVRAMGWA